MTGGTGFRAAVFDMDGLLIDSEPLWRVAEMEEFREVGIELDEAACEATMGQRTDEVVAHWFHRFPWTGRSCEDVAARITRRVVELIIARGEAMPGVYSAVDLMRQHGLRLALASSSPPEIIRAALDKIDLEHRFDVVCSAVQERFGKPHPAVFLRAAERLRVPASSCVVFEDSLAGIDAAIRAGMTAVAVPAAHLAGHPGFAAADACLRDLTELTPDWFAALGRTRRRSDG